jgi:hypothetical protein
MGYSATPGTWAKSYLGAVEFATEKNRDGIKGTPET